MNSDELNPWIVMHQIDGQVECLLWQLASGELALALFSSEAKALDYIEMMAIQHHRILHPVRSDLAHLFLAFSHVGVQYAVLDPDGVRGRRLFDLRAIALAISAGNG